MDKGELIQYKNNNGIWSDESCEFIEQKGDFCRIKRPNGEIIRLHHDRLRAAKEESGDLEVNEKFDPWKDLPENGEVWIKANRFNETTVCETIAIICPDQKEYRSINTYNGVAKKIQPYPMKNYDALIKRMVRREYEKQERPS